MHITDICRRLASEYVSPILISFFFVWDSKKGKTGSAFFPAWIFVVDRAAFFTGVCTTEEQLTQILNLRRWLSEKNRCYRKPASMPRKACCGMREGVPIVPVGSGATYLTEAEASPQTGWSVWRITSMRQAIKTVYTGATFNRDWMSWIVLIWNTGQRWPTCCMCCEVKVRKCRFWTMLLRRLCLRDAHR